MSVAVTFKEYSFPVDDLNRVDNLFKVPQDQFETFDVVKAHDVLQKTKFYVLLLKELFNLVKPEGYLEIKITQDGSFLINNDIRPLVFQFLADNMRYQFMVNQDHSVHRLYKISTALVVGDSINRWTIGLVTNGKREQLLEAFITSVIQQGIPEFELIVCGMLSPTFVNWIDRLDIPWRYIEFNERKDLGWITKKKNLICKAARFNNIAVFHDRFILAPNWFKGMQKYGNYFEVLSCTNKNDQGLRISDWGFISSQFARMQHGTVRFDLLYPYLLDYRDWDFRAYISGGVTLIKKNVWQLCPWDERRHWIEEEDTLLTNRQIFYGIVPRHNPYAEVVSVINKNEKIKTIPYSKDFYNLNTPTWMNIKRVTSLWIRRYSWLRTYFSMN